MFERFNTPAEVLEILEANIEAAQDAEVKDLLRNHQAESQDHVRNVEEVFDLFGWEIEDSSCPAIEGLEKEGATMVKKTDDSLVDSVILQGAVEVEHHEIGVYENLIINAEAMGRQDVVAILRRNIESEQAALEKVKALQGEVAAVTPKAAV